jgi:hypothetical protein
MSELDRKLTAALEEVGGGYTPSSLASARARFEARLRRRRIVRSVAGAALAAAVVVGLVVFRPLASDDRLPVGRDPGAPRGRTVLQRTFEVGIGPWDVEATDVAVYVAFAEGDEAASYDPSTGEARLRFPSTAGEGPTLVALGGDELFGVNRALRTVSAYDLVTGLARVTRSTPPEPTDVDFGGGLVWIASSQPGGPVDRYALRAHDPNSLRPVQSYKGLPSIAGIEYGYGYLWAATQKGLLRVDPDAVEIRRVAGMRAAADVSAGFGGLWAYANGRGTTSEVVRVDPASARVVERFPVEGFFGNVEAAHGAGVWVLSSTSEYEHHLRRLHPSTGEALGEALRLEGGAMELSGLGRRLWVTDESQGTLRRLAVVPQGS